MRIYIPTYRRPDQHTWRALSREARERVTFVVDERDYKTLKVKGVETLGGSELLLHPPEITTIAKKRAWIMRHAVESGHVKIVMLDDDLRFAVRTGEGVKLRQATAVDLDYHLAELSARLDAHVHAGWSARQGNNHMSDGWQQPASRMCYVLGYRPAVVEAVCELGRIETREDMDVTLQLLRQGFANSVSADVTADQYSGYAARGGCSEQRTMESSNADAEKLAELHPGLVRVVEKKYKSSTPRKEVIVQWKKAYESAGIKWEGTDETEAGKE